MDVICARRHPRVVVMGASQVTGKTECCVVNPIGFNVDLRPGPSLVVEPTLQMARALSQDRIDLMFRDTPRLALKRREDTGRREADSTMLFKAGPGWRITLVGANAPGGLAMRAVRDVYCDEPDRYPPSAGKEGDPIALADVRSTSFPDRVMVLAGSPTLEGASRIAKEYELTDQRRWFVPCPHCGHEQVLEWGGPNEAFGLKWERADDGTALAATAYYLCAGCAAAIDEGRKAGMNERGRWIASHPGRPSAGFHLSALPSPLITWAELVTRWLEVQGQPEEIKAFVNTRLARVYSPPGEKADPSAVVREEVGADAAGFPIVPMGYGLLTCGVDVQMDRLEVLVEAWGPGEESIKLGNWRLAGDVFKGDFWPALEALRTRTWQHASGAALRIRATGVDTSAYTKQVCDYVRPLERHGVFGLKGSSELVHELLTRPRKRSEKYKTLIWIVGTIAAKDTFFGRLLRIKQPGPGYQHFAQQIDLEFLRQLGGERAVWVTRGTQKFRSYEVVGDRANHAIDLSVYSLAALHALGDPVRRQLDVILSRVRAAAPPKDLPPDPEAEGGLPDGGPPPSPPPSPPVPPRRRSWVQGW